LTRGSYELFWRWKEKKWSASTNNFHGIKTESKGKKKTIRAEGRGG